MKTLKKLIYFLTSQERKRAILLMGVILFMALLDMVGVASIMPFMAVLTNPGLVETNFILRTMFQTSGIFGVETNQQFLFALGTLFFVLLVTSLAFKAFTSYALAKFIQMCQFSIGKRLIESYLHQPYSWFLNRHSADLGKSILSEVGIIVGDGLKPMMNLIAQGIVCITLIILLILIDPKLALIVGSTFSVAYGLIYKLLHRFLSRIGKERFKANQLRFTAVSEAFGAAKEIKVGGLEQVYIKRFADPAKIYAQRMASVQIVSQLPKYALEAIAFGGMLLLILYLMLQSGTFATALPIIALYALAGYRLMPALQQIYSSITSMRFVVPALDALYEDFKNLQPFDLKQSQEVLPLNNNIILNHIYFNYPNTSRTAVKDIYLNIPARTTVGLVGATGSGKTTTVDIILGLLEAQEGKLEIDGKVINKDNRKAWQRSIGYVPQNIYLADDTIAANIAFGTDVKDIDQQSVERVAKIANLHDFVINELPKKYETTVGERGVRLSGGQRQRIGIARALYHNPQLLVLDEATSALDNLTEKAVMEAVHNLGKDITIILIAHRLSTVKKCDIIFLLENGELKAQGTFEKLIEVNTLFRETAANL